MSFLEMNEQQRIEALTSGINSTGLKAATLWSMVRNTAYTATELATRVWQFLGSRPTTRNIPFQYCTASLEPIGMVVKSTFKGDMALAYEKTEDGFVYGNPSTARFLYAANELGISFPKMNGVANSSGKVRHGYVVATLLELLRDGNETRSIDLSQKTQIYPSVVGRTLADMQRLDVIEFASVKTDPYSDSQSGFSTATLINRQKLEYYIKNPEELRADVSEKRPHYGAWSYLINTLQQRAYNLEWSSLALTLRIHSTDASAAIAILCDLGVYRYEKFKGGEIQSSVKINYIGEFLFDNVYGPIIAIAREPQSREIMRSFTELQKGINTHELFKEEIERYVLEKRPSSRDRLDQLVYNAAYSVSMNNERGFRRKDIINQLESAGTSINRSTIHAVLQRLVRDGRLEVVEEGVRSHVATRYAISKKKTTA